MTMEFDFSHTPEEIVAEFRKKGFEISFDWKDVWKEANQIAFTVAKAMSMDILEDIRELTDKSLAEGITFEKFLAELEPKLKAKGWWGKQKIIDPRTDLETEVQLGSTWRLKTIYNTNLQVSYQCGRYRRMTRPSEKNHKPYWQYIAILDSRTRPSHGELHGKIVPADDDGFWSLHYPPNGFNCRCTVRALSEKELPAAGLKTVMDADGTMRNVSSTGKIESGKSLSSLTKPDEGWDYNPCENWQPDRDYAKLQSSAANEIFASFLAKIAETLYD